MDIAGYINSGILETYVLGLATEEESKQLLSLAKQFPAIRIELNNTEEALFRFATLMQKEPPAVLRNQIIKEITSVEPTSRSDVKVLKAQVSRTSGSWLIAFTICFILLAASLTYIYFQHQQIQQHKTKVTELQVELQSVNSRMNKQSDELILTQQSLEVVTKTGNKIVQLKGSGNTTSVSATIYWNAFDKQVFLEILTLPGAPTDKQYQLWAMVAGTAYDLGVFDVSSGSKEFKLMKAVDNPQSFMVTLENAGGNSLPDSSAVWMVGNL